MQEKDLVKILDIIRDFIEVQKQVNKFNDESLHYLLDRVQTLEDNLLCKENQDVEDSD